MLQSYNFDGSYRETGGATTAGAGTTPMGINTSTTVNSSRIAADSAMVVPVPSYTAGSTAMPAIVFTTSANFPPHTSRLGSINRNDDA